MKHRSLNALRLTIITCAIIHLILLCIYAVLNNDFNRLNGFDILDIDLFIPQMGVGVYYFIASYILIGGLYVYYFFREKNKRK